MTAAVTLVREESDQDLHVVNGTDIPYRNFRVRWDVPDPDPHHFDGNRDGIGCES